MPDGHVTPWSPPALTVRPRFHDWPGRAFDAATVALLLLVGGVILLTTARALPRLSMGRIPAYAVLGVALVGVLLRRVNPLITWSVIAAAIPVEALVGTVSVIHPLLLVATYTVAARLPWRRSALLSAAAMAVYAAVAPFQHGSDFNPPSLVADAVAMSAAYAVGLYVGTRMDYVGALRERARQLERERQLVAEQAAAEERVRIARELHDVVAHDLSLLIVQATALQTQVDADSPAHITAHHVAEAGRRAMDDMRRMLGVLRVGSTAALEHAPQPGIADIPALAGEIGATGVEIELSIDDAAVQRAGPGAALCAYRIVQEALTNMLRHSGATHCRVQLRCDGARLEIRVTDDGRGSSTTATGQGHGLVGMQERVAAFGGELFIGDVPGGGFAVRATLPLLPA